MKKTHVDSSLNTLPNIITVFHNDEFGSLKTLENNGQPWFLAKDVSHILGYKNFSNTIESNIDEEDKQIFSVWINGQIQQLAFINEIGLHSLILKSSFKKSKEFKSWITSSVSPTLRKKETFDPMELLNNPDLLLKVATKLKNEQTARVKAEEKIKLLMHQDKLFTTTEIAKEINFSSAIKLNNLLEKMQIQYRCNDCWVPTAKYASLGYTSIKQSILENGDVVYNRMWTTKGREFLLNLFKETGLYN